MWVALARIWSRGWVSSLLKKESDPLEGLVINLKSRCPERVRPVFQQAVRQSLVNSHEGRMGQTQYDDDEDGWPDDEDDGYIPCPHCGEPMLEAADHCPACNRWMSKDDLPRKQHPWWVVVVILALLAAMMISIF